MAMPNYPTVLGYMIFQTETIQSNMTLSVLLKLNPLVSKKLRDFLAHPGQR